MALVLKLTALVTLCWAVIAQQTAGDVLDFIDPLIGTTNGGHVFAGATLPFGMAKAVADTDGENQAGFASSAQHVTGFSHMHDSGTGGASSMGQFPIFPHAGCPGDDVTQCKFASADRQIPFVNGTIESHPGYFALNLSNSIRAEMTVSNHTALYRFTFPETPGSAESKSTLLKSDSDAELLSPLILVDLADLPQSRSGGGASVDSKTGRLTGNGTFSPSFGDGNYNLHFCIDFSGAPLRETGVFQGEQVTKGVDTVEPISTGSDPTSAGAFSRFKAPTDGKTLTVRAGVSFISVDQACSSAEKEIPNYDFEATRKSAEEAWEQKLSPIKVDASAVDNDLQTVFWSGVYRTLISPQDYTGENPLWKSDEPYYDSYYCIWDSFRSIHPFITLVDPYSQSLMVRSLVDIYRHEGYLPDCRMSLCKGYTQGGSNADIVLTDAYLKKISGVDWATAYEAMVKDAEVEPADWSIEGRGNLASWKSLGYVPTDDRDRRGNGPFTRSISRTVEYAYDDFCIAEMAQALGHASDHDKYIKRAGNWINMYKDSQTSSIDGTDTGFTGFLQPRFPNGTYGFQDPIFCSPLLNFSSCYLNADGHETYEGSCWLYTFFAPQDMGSLIKTLGGPEKFTDRLSYLHDSGLLYVGDEQAFLTVYQFHYVGRPGLSAKQAHAYVPSMFNTTLNGIPGNDDSGAMGSFVALTMMGVWPVAGQDVYLITPPFFKEVSITNPMTGKVATIRNTNFDSSYKSIYIQSATRDGKAWTKNWLEHDFFLNGGVLELTLGSEESDWGKKEADLPPSISKYST